MTTALARWWQAAGITHVIDPANPPACLPLDDDEAQP